MEPERHDQELHQLDPTGRFSDRAADYVRYRPSYPAPAIDAIFEGLAEPGAILAADVGAGTGIAARLLADRGARVVAIEPNAAMRESASPHDGVEWRAGTAEATGIAGSSVDLVVCAQAFHWFRAPAALEEFHRILRPGGRLALIWNSRDARDPLTRGYIEAIRAVGGEHPAERHELDPRVLDSRWFGPARFEAFEHRQELDRAGLIGRALSASYVPKEGSAFAALRQLLDALFERHRDARGWVTLRYVTKLYRSIRRS